MATGGEKQVSYSLVKDRTIKLENANERHSYNSIVICQDKIIVTDYKMTKITIHRLHDGKFLDMLDKLDCDSSPNDICLMDAMTICVLYDTGQIQMVSIKSEDMSPVFTIMNSFRLDGVLLDTYQSVVRVNDKIVVTGENQDIVYWCIVSLDDRHVDTIHQICKGSEFSHNCVTTKDNTIYISCYGGVKSPSTGVYGFDILNPSQCKYTYKHQRLQWPASVVINEDGNIFVGNSGFHVYSCIHHLTASCQPVAIFTQGIPSRLTSMLCDHGQLYVTCFGSHDITVFLSVYQGSHTKSKVLVSDESKQPSIEELAIQIAHINVDNGQSCVETEMPPSVPSPEDSEDEKQGSHKESEVLVSDERKQPGIEESATQRTQGDVENGRSRVETKMPPSGLSPEDSEDEKHGNHTHSEVPISDEGKRPIIEGTPKQIGQDILLEQIVDEALNQAGIRMTTKERDLFIKFQNEIGTDIYFSKSPHRLIDSQGYLKGTDTFFEESRPDMMDRWLEYKSQGKLTHELIDVIFAKERNTELHDMKHEILGHMEDLNIIVKARSFDKNGVKEDNYFFAPCMLRLESPGEVIAPEQDPRMLRTSVLCWVFTGTFQPSSIFDELLAACLARWPVAKKKDTLKHQISHSSTVFELDLTHRLTLNFKNHVIFATVTWLVIDDITNPDAKLCTMVRMVISRKLSKITNSLKQNLQYELCVQSQEPEEVSEDSMLRFSPFQIWFEDEINDPDSPIKREHMNHARLCVALVTVFGKALRDMLLDKFPVPYRDIYQTILANQARLIGGWGIPLLNQEQINLVFPDPLGHQTGTVENFDLSILYSLIRNVSTVNAPSTGWGNDPQPSDKSLGASVERIRSYRNRIIGHSIDAKINDDDFKDYWKKFNDVLDDIEVVLNRKMYSKELKRQRLQLISIFDDY